MDDPPYLTVGTEVSAKYKGAFCEAKIRKVVRVVKCRVLFKSGLGSFLISDEGIKGTLRVGASVEAKHPDRGSTSPYFEATINKIQDCSQYTVVFDDGDITTLRRSALCLKSGRHFNESETLDQLPLTHPEHFSSPVVGGSGRRGVRRRAAPNSEDKEDSSDDEEDEGRAGGSVASGAGTSSSGGRSGGGTAAGSGTVTKKKTTSQRLHEYGTVVTVEISDNKTKKSRDSWFPALVVSPTAQETVKIRVREECLVRSFKDGRYYTVPKKEINEFVKESHGKTDSCSTGLKTAVEKATLFLDKDELPPHWDRDALFGSPRLGGGDNDDSDSDADDEVVREKKDNFVAQLYKFMEERGTPINKGPTVCNKDLDLHKLYSVVVDQGGYSKVTNGGQWKNITARLGFGNMPSTSTINLVKQAYKKYLLHFDELNKKLGYNIHTAAVSKPRNSRSVYRSSGTPVPPAGSNNSAGTSAAAAAAAAAASKKEKEKETIKELADLPEEEGSKKGGEMDSDSTESSKKSSAVDDGPRRSRSRQESSRSGRKNEKEKESGGDDAKEKLEPKKRGKSGKEKDSKEPKQGQQQRAVAATEAEEVEPPSPAPSSQSSSSKKGGPSGGGSSARKSKKEKDAAAAALLTSVSASSTKEGLLSSEQPSEGPAAATLGLDSQKKMVLPLGGADEIPGCIGKDVKIQIGDKLLVIYPKGDHNVTYDAKVLDANEKSGTFFVHYLGWNIRYDEWISRGRIAENLSLRENYQSKAQGKGPGSLVHASSSSHLASVPPTSSAPTLEEEKTSKGKKQGRGRSVTPAPTPPLVAVGSPSTTGTRSKTANASSSVPSPTPPPTGKRKRLSTSERSSDPSEPSSVGATGTAGKKKRRYKKDEKPEPGSDSDLEMEDGGKSAPPVLPVRTPTPTRASSASKIRERKLQIEKEAKSASITDDAKKGQLLDLAAIRSEMKGVDKMVKGSKAPTPKVSISPPSLLPGGGDQKLDIYDFEEDNFSGEAAPKLKMFSPRSPEKKDDKDEGTGSGKEKDKATTVSTSPATTAPPIATPTPTTIPTGKGNKNIANVVPSTSTPATVTVIKQPHQSGSPGVVVPLQATSQPPPSLSLGKGPPPLMPSIAKTGRSSKPVPGPTSASTTSGPQGRGRESSNAPTSGSPPQTLTMYHATSPLVIPRPVVGGTSAPQLPSPYLNMDRPVSSLSSTPSVLRSGGSSTAPLTPAVVSSTAVPSSAGVIQKVGTPSLIASSTTPAAEVGQTYFPRKQEIFPHLVQQVGRPGQEPPGKEPQLAQHHVSSADGPPEKKKRTPAKPRIPPTTTSSEATVGAKGRGKDKSKPISTPTPSKAKGQPQPGEPQPKKRRGESPSKCGSTIRNKPSVTPSSHPPPPKILKMEPHQGHAGGVGPVAVPQISTQQVKEMPVSHHSSLPTSDPISKINETISSLMHNKSTAGPPHPHLQTGTEKLSSYHAPISHQGPLHTPMPTAASKKLMDSHLTGAPSAPPTTGKGHKVTMVELTIPSPSPPSASVPGGHGPATKHGAAAHKPVGTPSNTQVPKQQDRKPHPQPIPSVIAAIIPSKVSGAGSVSHNLLTSSGTEPNRVESLPVVGSKPSSGPSSTKLLHPRDRDRRESVDDKKHLLVSTGGSLERKLMSDKIKKEGADTSRPLTPSFLQSQETLEPDEDEEFKPAGATYTLSAKAVILPVGSGQATTSSNNKGLDVTEESCSSLLCEEEIPGSPAPGGNSERLKFDFSRLDDDVDQGEEDDDEAEDDDEDDDEDQDEEDQEMKMNEKADKKKPVSRPTLLPKKGGGTKPQRSTSRRGESLVVIGAGDSPPSTPDSPASFSTETGSPHIDGRISPHGEECEDGDGGISSPKSKEEEEESSDDGESGGDAKGYYSRSPRLTGRNKSVKTGPGGGRPKISVSSLARGRSQVPISHSPLGGVGVGGKKRKLIRKRSPTDDYAKQFGYRGIRSASGRKIQSSIDVHEAIRGPPPPPVNLAKRPHSEKFNHLYANLEGIEDPEERIALVVKSMQDIREEYLKVKARIQTRERKERRRKRKLREKATAERQARLEAAKTLSSQTQNEQPPVPVTAGNV